MDLSLWACRAHRAPVAAFSGSTGLPCSLGGTEGWKCPSSLIGVKPSCASAELGLDPLALNETPSL